MHALVLVVVLLSQSESPPPPPPAIDPPVVPEASAPEVAAPAPDAGTVVIEGQTYRVLQGKTQITVDAQDEAYTPPPLEAAPEMASGLGTDRDVPSPESSASPTAPSTGPSTTPGPSPRAFIKGELSAFLGADRVVTKNNRIGVSVGFDRIGSVYYALLEPQVDLRFLDSELAIGLGVPLRLEAFSFDTDPTTGKLVQAANLGKIRKQDYDEPGDYARILKYVTYGHKEDQVYVNVGQRYASSIGHGAIVRRYAPNIDVDRSRVSAQFDAYNDYGGVELLSNDVVAWDVLSGLAFIKPLSFFTKDATARSLSLGFSIASDLSAPETLSIDPDTGLRQLDESNHLQASTRAVTLLGVDAEMKVLKTRNADIKPYVDYSLLSGGDGGFTVGALGRFNVGDQTVNAFRLVLEGRYLGSRYVPSYFDTFYEVERFMMKEVPSAVEGARRYATKQEVVRQGLGERVGYYAEASWGIRGSIGVTLAMEGTNAGPEKNAVAHLEVPALNFLQFFGSYYKRGFTDFSQVTELDQQSIFFAGARLKILPILFINGRAFKTFRVSREYQRYDNSMGFAVDVEVGYEFKAAPPKTEALAAPEATLASEGK